MSPCLTPCSTLILLVLVELIVNRGILVDIVLYKLGQCMLLLIAKFQFYCIERFMICTKAVWIGMLYSVVFCQILNYLKMV